MGTGSRYFPSQLESDAEFALMENTGINVVRLGVMWSGVNPTPGVVNRTYLGVLQGIVKKYADRGIYTILDLHQDVCRANSASTTVCRSGS